MRYYCKVNILERLELDIVQQRILAMISEMSSSTLKRNHNLRIKESDFYRAQAV